LVLSKKMSYEMMSQKVADYLEHESTKLRFTTSNANGTPNSVLEWSLNQTIFDILQPTADNAPLSTVIFYEQLDISVAEMETMCSLKIRWTGIYNKEEAQLSFLLPKTSMVHNLADHIAHQVTLSARGSGKVRVFEISKDGCRQKVFTGTELLGNLSEVKMYAEQVPMDELYTGESDKIIDVFHFTTEPSRTHGVPFRFVVRPDEKFSDTKKRLQARMGVSGSSMAQYRFALVHTRLKQPNDVDDEDVLYDHNWSPDDVLGLDHTDKTRWVGRTGGNERAIVIRD